jgi:DNA-binding NarL/FixJ family response regulator
VTAAMVMLLEDGIVRGAEPLELLTAREREIVERALLGSENKCIAYDLGLSDSTVRVLMSRAAIKLGVRTRRELLAKVRASSTATRLRSV